MRTAIALVLATAAVVAAVAGATAAGSGGGPLLEPTYYESEEVGLLVPSGSSHNPNQVLGGGGCFPLGPDMGATGREKAALLYALFVPGATQYGFQCANPALRHDHVIGVAPGDPGYSAAWRVSRVTPGPNFDVADMPYTTAAEVRAGIEAGELVASDTGFSFRAPVVPLR
jgi:hypothetical protein